MNDPWNWGIEDLKQLFGQPESLRLDFKQSAIFTKSSEKVSEEISKEVTSFANTEGGVIVVGIEEIRVGKSRVGDKLDQGISINEWSPERIQQIVESNIYPPLSGIRFKAIFIDETHLNYYLVIFIPKGTTAYQARDFIYYGRSEFESKPLRDHEIRLRMFRGKISEAVIELNNLQIHQTNESRSVDGKEIVFITGRNYKFQLLLKNIGEININHFKLRYQFSSPGFDDGRQVEMIFRDGMPAGKVHSYMGGEYQGVTNIMVFPGDEFLLRDINYSFNSAEEFLKGKYFIKWQLFLPDRQPLNGEINLTEEFRSVKCEIN